MSVSSAKETVIQALHPLPIVGIDHPKIVRAEGNLLVFEGLSVINPVDTLYRFGLYVSKKVLNQKTETIYDLLDVIREKMKAAKLAAPSGDRTELMRIEPFDFSNGVLEYRCLIEVQERMP